MVYATQFGEKSQLIIGWRLFNVLFIIYGMDDQNQENGFKEIPHSADLALDVWATSLPGLFVEAARGLYSLMQLTCTKGEVIHREMKLEEDDLENLLVSFLNELLVDVQQSEIVYDQFNLEIDHFSLQGKLTGYKNSSFLREIKAATYHELKIIKIGSKYKTRLTFDI